MKNTEKMVVTVTPSGTYQQVKKSEVHFVVDEEPKTTAEIQKVANAVAPEDGPDRIWSVMLFWRRYEIEDSTSGEWVMPRQPAHFDSHFAALNCYANTPCPASQIIGAPNIEKLKEKEEEMIRNFQNQEWLEEYLYPYL